MRKLLSSTILGGALAFTAIAGMQQASAGAFHDLSPNSEWAVTKIESKNTGARPYCALAQRFTNDVVLTFARNQDDETSIAIDFQKPRLSQDQYYSVKVDAGFGQTREFNIKPVSDAAVVIKVGSDYAFLEALGRSSLMKADIEGYEYAFNIKDFSDGQMKMGGCLATLVEPAAGGDFDAPISGSRAAGGVKSSPLIPVADERQLLAADPVDTGYVSKISNAEADMAREIDNLKDENNKLRTSLENERRDFENKFMERSQDSSAMIELSEKVQLLEVENNELRHKVTDMAVSQAKTAAVPSKVVRDQCEPELIQDTAMMRELKMLRDENSKLQLHLKQAQASVAASTSDLEKVGSADKQMAQDLNNRISFLEQENRTLKTQLNESMQMQASKTVDTSKLTTLQGKIDTLEFDNTKLQAKVEQQKLEIAKFDGQNDKAAVVGGLQQRVDALMAENAKLSNTIEGMGSTSGAGAASSPFLVSKVSSLETQLGNVKRERDSLLVKMDDMNRGREDQLIDISSDNWNLEQATRRYNEAEREIQRLGLQLEQERSTCATQKHEIEYMLFDPSIATKEQIARLNKAEEKAAKAETLLDAQKTGYDGKVTALTQDVTRLQGDIGTLEGKLKVAETEFNNGFGDYKEKLAAREGELGSKIAAYETQIKSLSGELALKTAKLDEATAALNVKTAALDTKASEIATKNALIGDLKAQQGDIAQMKVSVAEMEKLQREKDFLIQKTAELEKDNVSLSQAVRSTKQQVADLQTAKSMNVIEASAGGDLSSKKVEREALPLPTKVRDAGPVALSPKAADPYVDTMSAQSMEQAAKATLEINTANVTMTGVEPYLKMAGITVENSVKQTENRAGFAAYSWETNGLYGSAEQRMTGSSKGFDALVTAYLSETKARCSGDFAASPSTDETISGIHVTSYEIACVSNDVSAAASIVFIEEHGQFTAIAHEAGLDYMDYAMDMRDKLISSFGETKMAAR